MILAHQGGWDDYAQALAAAGILVVLLSNLARHAPHRALPSGARPLRAVAFAVMLATLLIEMVVLGPFGADATVRAAVGNLILPGLGFFHQNLALAIGMMLLAGLAIIAWLRWGVDWLVIVVWTTAIIWAFEVVHPDRAPSQPAGLLLRPLHASHEFFIVMLVVAFLNRVRNAVTSLPGLRRRRRRRPPPLEALGSENLRRLHPVDRARVAGVMAVVERLGQPVPERSLVVATLEDPSMRRRARTLGVIARARLHGDPLQRDNAGVRAALVLWGGSSVSQRDDLKVDARRSWCGVPATEPGWVRPLDATIAAVALAELGEQECVERWIATYETLLAMRGAHRPGSLYCPLAVPGPTGSPWEHAAASALARVLGWIGDDDWAGLRRPALGAAARRGESPQDERLVAAGRIWAQILGDEQALKILHRPRVGRDALAVALDRVAGVVQLSGVPPLNNSAT
jgi:hypothetical protein